MIVTSFYKYIKLNPETFRKKHQTYCDKLGIKGKVLVAEEGINGSVSGKKEQINKYKKNLLKNKKFKGVMFKDTTAEKHPFKRMIVRIRPEIVTLGKKIDLKKSGRRISPTKLKEWIENEKIVLLDARNNYESRIGKFYGAITPNINTFRHFPTAVRKLEAFKDQKIVTYCTGGIRCEKASALLKQQGFQNVYQLDGGILNFIQQYPDTHFEGRCFVFDSRLSVPTGKSNGKITTCDICTINCDDYINCRNVKCDKLFICCGNCKNQFKETCSKKCRNIADEQK